MHLFILVSDVLDPLHCLIYVGVVGVFLWGILLQLLEKRDVPGYPLNKRSLVSQFFFNTNAHGRYQYLHRCYQEAFQLVSVKRVLPVHQEPGFDFLPRDISS